MLVLSRARPEPERDVAVGVPDELPMIGELGDCESSQVLTGCPDEIDLLAVIGGPPGYDFAVYPGDTGFPEGDPRGP